MVIEPSVYLVHACFFVIRERACVLQVEGPLNNANQAPALTAEGWNDEPHVHTDRTGGNGIGFAPSLLQATSRAKPPSECADPVVSYPFSRDVNEITGSGGQSRDSSPIMTGPLCARLV